jgi:hypothetical protein
MPSDFAVKALSAIEGVPLLSVVTVNMTEAFGQGAILSCANVIDQHGVNHTVLVPMAVPPSQVPQYVHFDPRYNQPR